METARRFRDLTPDEQRHARHLIAANEGLAVHMAFSFRASSLPFDDRCQVARLALVEVAYRFPMSRYTPRNFGVYAGKYIKGRLIRAVCGSSDTYVPQWMQDRMGPLRRVMRETGDIHKAAGALGVSAESTKALWEAMHPAVSFDAPVRGADGEPSTFGELVGGGQLQDPEEEAVTYREWRRQLRVALNYLSERRRFIVEHSFGLDGLWLDDREMAGMLGIDAASVGSARIAALHQLRRWLVDGKPFPKPSVMETVVFALAASSEPMTPIQLAAVVQLKHETVRHQMGAAYRLGYLRREAGSTQSKPLYVATPEGIAAMQRKKREREGSDR